MTAVIERVDSLEQTVQNFVRSVGVEFRKFYNSQRQTEAELRDFKDKELSNKLGDLGRGPSRSEFIPYHRGNT